MTAKTPDRTRVVIDTRVFSSSRAGMVAIEFKDELRSVILTGMTYYYPLAIARYGADSDNINRAYQQCLAMLNRLRDEALSIAEDCNLSESSDSPELSTEDKESEGDAPDLFFDDNEKDGF